MSKTKLKYFIQKIDGERPRLENSDELTEFWANAPAGRYTCDIKRIPKEKTHKQVKTIFGLLIATAIAEVNDKGTDTSGFLKLMMDDTMPTGVPLNKDLLKNLLYSFCPIYNDKGERITLSKASSVQAAKFFEDCRDLLASRGIMIPDPVPDWKTLKNKELAK